MFTLPVYKNEVHGENNRNKEFTLSDKTQIIDQYFNFVENQQHQEQLRLSQPQNNHKIFFRCNRRVRGRNLFNRDRLHVTALLLHSAVQLPRKQDVGQLALAIA